MNSKRFFYLMNGLVILLGITIITATVVGNNLLQKQAQKLTALKLDNRVLDEQQTSLTQAKKDVEKYAELEKEAKAIVPQDKDQAEAVREIVKIANDTGVKLSTISFPASTLGSTAPAPSSTSGTSGATSTAIKAPPVTQVKPAEGIPGLYVMEITLQQDASHPISYSGLINFLDKLEQNRRTAQVTSVTIQPTAQNPDKLTFNLLLNVYIKP